jgi:hypothetical protein
VYKINNYGISIYVYQLRIGETIVEIKTSSSPSDISRGRELEKNIDSSFEIMKPTDTRRNWVQKLIHGR